MQKKVVLLLLDGLADLPIKGTTPLKDAKKPNLDYLANNGITGEITVLPKKFWTPEVKHHISQLANISLLGFSPQEFPLKRGPLEAVGSDTPYQEGHLALRCNFATVDSNLKVVDRRVGRNIYGLDELVHSINEEVDIGVPFMLKRTYGHRCVLIIKKNLSDKITINDPLHAGKKIKEIKALSSQAKTSAELVQLWVDRVYNLLAEHPVNSERKSKGFLPANYILVSDAGNKLYDLPNFPKRWKLGKAVCLAENGVVKATCMLADFNAVTMPEIPLKEGLEFIFDNVQDLMTEYSFVYAHIKWTDSAAHDGDFKKKKEAIEAVDKKLEMFKKFDGIVIVTCDHITSTKLKSHMSGKVPILIYGLGKDGSKTFDEFSVKKGKLKNYTPSKLWKLVFRKSQ
jgi:2,3-bisphosphoglycerate-independent phosphoglycerate mutase